MRIPVTLADLLSNTGRLLRLRKILFVATVSVHFRSFYLPHFDYLEKNGWEVSLACLDPFDMPGCDKTYKISIDRFPCSIENIFAHKQLKQIINKNNFDVIHCSTPTAGVLARMAARKARKHGAKVIYTAHGFHFYIGAPYLNWLVYYPAEYLLSRVTDILITINDEDYCLAKKHFKAADIVHVHGVGYDDERFFKHSQAEKVDLRQKNGYADSDVLLVYVAELNKNKNQKLLIKAFERISKTNKNTKLLLIGPDRLSGENQRLAQQLGLETKVDFLGYREDVHELLPMCDLTVASSFREGLPVNTMESLACGLPVVAVDNRGHRALINNGENGFLTKLNSAEEISDKVLSIIENDDVYRKVSDNASKDIIRFSKEHVLEEMEAVYGKM